MEIIVCIKQVPATNQVDIDPETGNLMRMGIETQTNPYDLYAIECALRIKEQLGGKVTALTMGPPQAEEMMRDAYQMGVDETVVLSDRTFAGADVLATSYTIAQGIKKLGTADLIICGKQSTDGDTAQIGPAIAEHLGLPHVAWVSSIDECTEKNITVQHELGNVFQTSKMEFPCLVTVSDSICIPRLPSYRLKKATKDKAVTILSFQDLPEQDKSQYGANGSPTTVERIFPPEVTTEHVYFEGDSAKEKAEKLFDLLLQKKFVGKEN